MKYTFEKGKKSTVKVTMKLTAEEWSTAIDGAYQKTKGRYSVPGFRKGKVPKKVLESAYGTGVFYEEAINQAFPKYYGEVLDKEPTIKAVAAPEIDVKDISEKGITLIAIVPVRPDVTLGEYKGIKVVTSALDQIAGITGAGVVKEGLMSETTGTALAVCALTNKFPPYYEGLKVSPYYVKKGLYCLLMWAPTAGAMLEWFKRNFCEGLDYGKLNEIADKVPAGSEGLIALPHLCGTVMPENCPEAKGVFYGMEMKHTRGHFVRAIMESVAYMIREYVDFMNVPVQEIRSMGGGAKSKLWCNIKSSVLDKTIVTLKQNETACLGSAMFAGVGTGVFDSTEGAAERIVAIDKTYKADGNEYQNVYREYKIKEQKIMKTF